MRDLRVNVTDRNTANFARYVASRKTTKLNKMISTIQAKCAESSECDYIVL